MAQTSGPKGLEIRQAHFPGRAPVDSYGNGGFRFAEMSHRGSILCVPSGIYGWSASSMQDVDKASLSQVFEEDGIELLLLGSGKELLRPQASLIAAMSDVGIRLETMSTGAAARTFNVLLAEGRAVAAALLAVK